MSIIYIHGVKVRSRDHGVALGKPFLRWLAPSSPSAAPPSTTSRSTGATSRRASAGTSPPARRPRYCALAAPMPLPASARCASRPEHAARRGGVGHARRRARARPYRRPAAIAAPPLASVPRERRADFVADLYLAVHPRRKRAEDPIAEDAHVAPLADAAAEVADQWDVIVTPETSDATRAARLVSEVEKRLTGSDVVAMGGFADWMNAAGEALRRAAVWPGDAVSTVFAELRPVVNEFVSYFIGDILATLTSATPRAPLKLCRSACSKRCAARTSAGRTPARRSSSSPTLWAARLYDALTFYAPHDPALQGLVVDHWLSCGAQVSLFAELCLFKGQPTDVAAPATLPRPAAAQAWTNFYDLNDLVGFVMAPIFAGVTDKQYDTGFGLAFAHTGYLGRPSFFEAMAAEL